MHTQLNGIAEYILNEYMNVIPPVYPLQRRGELTEYQKKMLGYIKPFILMSNMINVERIDKHFNHSYEFPVPTVLDTLYMAQRLNESIKSLDSKYKNTFYRIKMHLLAAVVNDSRFDEYVYTYILNTKNKLMLMCRIDIYGEPFTIGCPYKNIKNFVNKERFVGNPVVPEEFMYDEHDDVEELYNQFVVTSLFIFHNKVIFPELAGRVELL